MAVRRWNFLLTLFTLLSISLPLQAADEKVAPLNEAPAGLSAEIAAAISDSGYRITDASGIVCDLWFARDLPLKPKFKANLRVKYPLQAGQLVGVIRYPASSKPNDFRGQALKPGTYILRYGLQPDDGNHLGTSDIRDFLVGCPPDKDKSPARISDVKQLFKLSAGAAGTSHPAIFLLIPPPEQPVEGATVVHDTEKHLLIFQASAPGKDGDKAVPIPFKIVTVGKSDG
ncbi:MAG: hypothetical protein JSS02_28405 [Planctomycetes bacterium]|nr:hypothetical protein [Planctomycetota bacterium]